MKKLISLVLILCMACMLVPAMAEEDITGDWYLVEITVEDQTINPADMGMSQMYSFKEGGVLEATSEIMGQQDAQTGTWTIDGNAVTMTLGDTTVSGTIVDGKITFDANGQIGVLSKEAPVASVKPTVAAGSEDAFIGTWTLSAIDMMGVHMEGDKLEGYAGTMTIEAGKVISDIAMQGQESQKEEMPSKFEEGKLVLTLDTTGEAAELMKQLGMELPESATIELMEDGSILYSTEILGMSVGMYFVRTDAAEQPAA